jgi:hypothetical protein
MGEIGLNHLQATISMLSALVEHDFLLPPSTQYTLEIDTQNDRVLKVFQGDYISRTNVLKLTKTEADKENKMPHPTPNDVTNEDLAQALKDFNEIEELMPQKNKKGLSQLLRKLIGLSRPLPSQNQPNPVVNKKPTSPIKRWFDIFSQKTTLLQKHEELGDDLLRHLFVSTIQHLQLGYSLLSERRARTAWPPQIPEDELDESLKKFHEHFPRQEVAEQTPPARSPIVKLWWQDEKRFENFASMAKQVICAAYDRALHQTRWQNRDKSPLARYLQNAIHLGKMSNHPKFNNPPKWDTLPNAAETFARSLQLALRSPAAYLETNFSYDGNLSFLLADLEKKLGLYPNFTVNVPKETVDSPKTAP